MFSINTLNDNAYPGTEFHISKDEKKLLMSIALSDETTKTVEVANIEDVINDKIELYDINQKDIDSSYNFLTKTLVNSISTFEKALKKNKKDYPYAQAFMIALPPEATLSNEQKDNTPTIVSKNPIVKSNMEKLNEYMFSYVKNIANKKTHIMDRPNIDEAINILNQKNFKQMFQKRENPEVLRETTKKCLDAFSPYVYNIARNEKFLQFIRNNPERTREQLINIARSRVKTKLELQSNLKQASKTFNDAANIVASKVLVFAIQNSKKSKEQKISSIVQSLKNTKDANSL